MLATGATGAGRLDMLQRLYGPTTELLLDELGIGPGMRVADIGCGVGNVVAWMSPRVGRSGTAVGVDISVDQLAVAGDRIRRDGLTNVQLVTASAYETGLPPSTFDIVCCRSVLSHLVDPRAAVRHMSELVKSGGFVVCEDIDISTIRTDPPSSVYQRVVALYFDLSRINKCDYSVGSRLTRLPADAGLREIDSRSDQPAPRAGDDKRWWEYTFAETLPTMESRGVVTHEEGEHLLNRMVPLRTDSTTAIYQPERFQAWGRMPR